MSRQLYQNYLKLFEKWPVDKTKTGRDLGEFIRAKFSETFSKGEVSTVPNIPECTVIYESLDRIASNYHSRKYPRLYNSTSTNLTVDQCKLVLSNESMKLYKEIKM
ncbi:UNVERIFIED_CONTAM: hypothetical protein RMT77_012432 [Armadillidium vulgare]